MNFKQYYTITKPTINAYCYDANDPKDYLAVLMCELPLTTNDQSPVVLRRFLGTYIATRTHFLFYFLHKLHVRPENK